MKSEPPMSACLALRILIVDDNRDSALGLAMLLGLDGHDVRVAHTGLEALELARRDPPDVVLLDIGLPDINGYRVAERLRREDACQGCSIIAISGYCREEDQRRTREAGFDHFLSKPVEHDGLMALLAGSQKPLAAAAPP